MARLNLREKVQKKLADARVAEVMNHGQGKGTDKIADNYCKNKINDDIQKILDRCGNIWAEACLRDELRKQKQCKK